MSKKTAHKLKTENVTYISPSELDGLTLFKLKERIDEYIADYGNEAKLDWDQYYHEAYEHNPSPRYNIVITRLETDAELQVRLGYEARLKRDREEKDRAEFERLQALFKDKK
jgi:hypothetical protein